MGKLRFTYFTDKYEETYNFYKNIMDFGLEYEWNRSEDGRGALFKAGSGSVEILNYPSDKEIRNQGLDYRKPQGVYMCIQVSDIDDLYRLYNKKGVTLKQEIVNQPWGHRSFSVIEPNGLILFLYEEKF